MQVVVNTPEYDVEKEELLNSLDSVISTLKVAKEYGEVNNNEYTASCAITDAINQLLEIEKTLS